MFAVNKYTGEKRHYILNNEELIYNNELVYNEKNVNARFIHVIMEIFLPSGYPDTVTLDYINFQVRRFYLYITLCLCIYISTLPILY